MSKPKPTPKPAATQAGKPLSLADITVTVVRQTAGEEEEEWEFSGEQLALLLAANEYEGSLVHVAHPGEIAEEMRGLSGCLEYLSALKLHGVTRDEDGADRVVFDFLGRSLQRLADRTAVCGDRKPDPERYRVEIRQPAE
jgi:hypothetical protein